MTTSSQMDVVFDHEMDAEAVENEMRTAVSENQCLLKGHKNEKHERLTLWSKAFNKITLFMHDNDENHVMEYDTRELSTWKTLFMVKQTIWDTKILWQTAGKLLLLGMGVGCVMVCQPHPEHVDGENFMSLANTLKVFVTFLLGFFMASSISRWGMTVEGFFILFNSSRNLNMQFHALGVGKVHRECIARFGVVSAIFLDDELSQRAILDPEEKARANDHIIDSLHRHGQLTEAEAKTLLKVSDRAGLVWVWVASLLGRMAQDGEIPGLASPTYGRLVQLAQTANDGIRRVRVSVAVQSPFVYVHTLAFLVHANNIFCAISFGCSLGTGFATIFSRHGIHVYDMFIAHRNINGTEDMNFPDVHDAIPEGSVSGDVQNMCMSFVTSFIFPVMLQAFLQIGLVLAQPFDAVSALPTRRMIANLRRDLREQDLVANAPTPWSKPLFQK